MSQCSTGISDYSKSDAPLSDDLLFGAAAIAAFIGRSERAVRHQLDRGTIPHKRMGRLLVGSKSTLRKHFQEVA
jgi:hypothetical protein